jgi:hypothetical protein
MHTVHSLAAGAVGLLLLGKSEAKRTLVDPALLALFSAEILAELTGDEEIDGGAVTLAKFAPVACDKLHVELAWIEGKCDEGHTFLTNFGGVGGVLRFEFHPHALDLDDAATQDDDDDVDTVLQASQAGPAQSASVETAQYPSTRATTITTAATTTAGIPSTMPANLAPINAAGAVSFEQTTLTPAPLRPPTQNKYINFLDAPVFTPSFA